MEINEQIVIGKLGQQPMVITDQTVDPEHATLKKVASDTYIVEDKNSQRGVFVFGIRVKRKTIRTNTPFFLGNYKTTVKHLLHSANHADLEEVWNRYDAEKRKWDRYTMWVQSIRMLAPIATTALAYMAGGQNPVLSIIVLVVLMAVAMVAGEKVLAKKNDAMAELNARMQQEYICPHTGRPYGLTPYKTLKMQKYCPHCNLPFS